MTRQYATSPFAESTHTQQVSAPPPTMYPVVSHFVVGSAAATTLLMATSALVATLNEGAIKAWWSSDAYEPLGVMDLLVGLEGLTVVTNLAAFVATGIWLLNLRQVAEWASPSMPHRRTSYWAFLGWIVPVVNLWFPYQVVQDASRGVGSKVKNLMPWWIAWLALFAVNQINAAGGELVTDADLTVWIRTVQILGVLAVVAFVLWFRVVRSATSAATAATDGVRVTS